MTTELEHQSPEAPAAGQRIGRYELMLELDRGPAGPRFAAYVLEGADEGRFVAVRRVRVGDADRDALARVSLAATGVRDPHIAALLNAREHGEELIVASEYVEGETLELLLAHARKSKAPIPPPVGLRIVLDTLKGLESARDQWKKGVALAGEPLASALYGGVCPAQIVVASFGDTLLSEVGFAGAALRLGRFACTASAAGHRAPEQLGHPPKADERTDIFQLGICLWELCANRPLFDKERVLDTVALDIDARAEVERRIREEPIRRLDSDVRQGPPLPEGLPDVVAKALERDPKKRFARYEEMAAALQALPVAGNTDVIVLVERLARAELDARRAALNTVAGSLSGPNSRRATSRPPGPDVGARVTLPNIVGLPSFGSTEAPTARRKPTPSGELEISIVEAKPTDALKIDASATETPLAAPPRKVESAPEVEVELEPEPTVPLRGSSELLQAAVAPAHEVPAKRTASRVGIYLAVVVAVALGLWWFASGREKTEGAEAPTSTRAVGPATAPTRESPKPLPSPSVTAADSAAPEPVEAPSSRPAEKDKPKPTRPAEPRPRPSSDFRPKGI